MASIKGKFFLKRTLFEGPGSVRFMELSLYTAKKIRVLKSVNKTLLLQDLIKSGSVRFRINARLIYPHQFCQCFCQQLQIITFDVFMSLWNNRRLITAVFSLFEELFEGKTVLIVVMKIHVLDNYPNNLAPRVLSGIKVLKAIQKIKCHITLAAWNEVQAAVKLLAMQS